MPDKTPRLNLNTFSRGETSWDHTDTVKVVDKYAIARGPINDRPSTGSYDDALYYATDQQVLWGWDEASGDWIVRGGLGSEQKPLPKLYTDEIKASRVQLNRPYVLYEDSEGDIVADGPGSGDLITEPDLPTALDAVYSVATHAVVLEGSYSYDKDLYLPNDCSVHFNNVRLLPDQCVGIRIGDGDSLHQRQCITGRVKVSSSGGAPTKGIYVHGAKILSVEGKIILGKGFQKAALHIDGGNEGSWWNNFSGLTVSGRVLINSTASLPANAQVFSSSLFRGQIDLRSGNALYFHNCWFEGISDEEKVSVQCTEPLLEGRFESVNLHLESNCYCPTIVFQRREDVSLQNDLDDNDGSYRIENPPGCTEGPNVKNRQFAESTSSVWEIWDTGVKQDRKEAAFKVVSDYPHSGSSQAVRTETQRRDGYHLLSTFRGEEDKEIVNEGDFVNYQSGKGFVVSRPDGSTHDRIRTDEDGNIIVDKDVDP